MSAWAKTAYFWRSAAQGIRHAPFVHFVAVVTLAIALFAVGLARCGARVMEELIGSLGGEVQVTVYLKPGAAEASIAELEAAIAQRTHQPPTRVTPEAALARLVRELGDTGAVLRDLPENPLPTSLEVRVPAEQRQPEALRTFAQQLRGSSIVSSVDYGEEAVERLQAIARLLRVGGLLGLGIVIVATVVIVSATLQLAIYARREEVEIQKLVGATNRFVKAPFLLEGLVQGLLGSAAALAALWAFFVFAGPQLGTMFAFLKVGGMGRTPLSASLAGELLALGVLLGLGGSFVAVGRFLKV